MTIVTAIFASLLFLAIIGLSKIKLPKTPEQEFGEAVSKYLTENRKKKQEQKEKT